MDDADYLAEKRARIKAAVGDAPTFVLKPVGWMLSPELVANLRSIFRRVVNPRRWMWLDRGHAHVEDGEAQGRWTLVRERRPAAAEGLVDHASTAEASGDGGHRLAPPTIPPSGAVWFDYAADLGDGVAAMYTTAFGLQADLAMADGGPLPTPAQVVAARAASTRLGLTLCAPGQGVLPRGEFLFVGGDTAYHVADHTSIVNRVQAPFFWAALALERDGRWDPRERRLYGIPGNHDWYDELDGFSQLFRRAAPPTLEQPSSDLRRDRYQAAQTIDLLGYQRAQHASYVALALPWGWQLWGLDIDNPLDDRQRRYFRSLCEVDAAGRVLPPAKLVVCTPSPPVVFHAAHASPIHNDAITALGLPRLYLLDDEPNPLPPGSCRLDLSGDVHHYARYSAPWDPIEGDQDARDTSYQSVVSGLGGAFLHPTDTVLGKRQPVAASVFPTPALARRETAGGTRFLTLLLGGWVRVVPLLLTMLFTWVWLQDGTARTIGDRVLARLGFYAQHSVIARDDWRVLARFGNDGAAAFWWKAVMMGAGCALLGLAFWWWRRVAATHLREPARRRNAGEFGDGRVARALLQPAFWRHVFDPQRSYWLVTLFAALGLGVLAVGPVAAPHYHHGLTVDTVVVLALALLPPVAGVATAVLLGDGLPSRRRALGGAVGALHLAIQLTTMVILARVALGSGPLGLGAIAAFLLANHLLAPALVRAIDSAPGRAAVLALAWLALVAGLWGGILVGADHEAVYGDGAAEQVLLMGGSALLAMLLGCAHFGWYLGVMSALGFHNNELGGAARVDRFRQFIRLRLTETGLTAYVIAMDKLADPRDPKARPRPFLIDAFEIKPRA